MVPLLFVLAIEKRMSGLQPYILCRSLSPTFGLGSKLEIKA